MCTAACSGECFASATGTKAASTSISGVWSGGDIVDETESASESLVSELLDHREGGVSLTRVCCAAGW